MLFSIVSQAQEKTIFQTIGLNQRAELPSIVDQLSFGGLMPADHATVAISDDKHILVVWQSRVDPEGYQYQVEGLLVRYLGNEQWAIPATAGADYSSYHMVLGDPAQSVFGAGNDRCRVPDVVAVGSHFIVAWPRIDSGSLPRQGRLETAFVEVDPADGTIAKVIGEDPALLSYNGVGYPVDGDVISGEAGVMPDVVGLGAYQAGILYASEQWVDSLDERFREYELRFAGVSFQDPTAVKSAQQVLVGGIPMDHFSDGTPLTGPKILPDIVRDARGDVVFAYGYFQTEGHRGSLPGESGIVMQHWTYAPLVGQRWRWQEASERMVFHQVDGTPAPMRRPNLAGNAQDFASGNDLLLAWMDMEGEPLGDVPKALRWVRVDYQASPPQVVREFADEGGANFLPVPLNVEDSLRKDGVVFNRYNSTTDIRTLWYYNLMKAKAVEVVGIDGGYPANWRPALATYESGDDRYVVLTWEGTSNVATRSRIHIKIVSL